MNRKHTGSRGLTVPRAAPDSGRWQPAVRDRVPGGFECSSHRLEDGRRLDLLASTRHDQLADQDYASARGVELKTQLVRASIEAIEAIRAVLPYARFIQASRSAT
jgi:hypothetical protein